MATERLTREARQLFQATARAYRSAFNEVQELLEETDLGRVPSWVFAIDRLSLDEVGTLSPEIVDAERRRRQWRVALHALVELIALHAADGQPMGAAPDETALAGVEAMGSSHLSSLDRFITVVSFAKAGGCVFVNGSFQPVERSEERLGTEEGDTRALSTQLLKR